MKSALMVLTTLTVLTCCTTGHYRPPYPPALTAASYEMPEALTSSPAESTHVEVVGLRIADMGLYVDLMMRGPAGGIDQSARTLAHRASSNPLLFSVRDADGKPVQLGARQVPASWAMTISYPNPPVLHVSDDVCLITVMLSTKSQLQPGTYSFRFADSWQAVLGSLAEPVDSNWHQLDAIDARLRG